jgi:4,5-dihydroxyphthalate decarboxylase
MSANLASLEAAPHARTHDAGDGGRRTVELRTVVRDQGNNASLKSGSVTPHGSSFAFEEVPVLIHAFRRMVRGLEWDVCEMAFATYLCAREHGVPFTAIPTFVMRGFHHGAVVHNPSAGLRSPKDLEGNRVGVNRGYTVTPGCGREGSCRTSTAWTCPG